jgi:pilus assembly protein CpaE
MNALPVNVSILYGEGSPNGEYREMLSSIADLKLLKEALDPETFLMQHREKNPDLVLVDLNGGGAIPEWLEFIISGLPQSEVMVCSHSRDPDFLIRIMKLRAGGFLPLPLNREEVLAAVQRVRVEKGRHQDPRKNQVLAVTGTKGGVGTTTIATNLAVALAEQMPGEVILVDLAKPFPHVGQFLDLEYSHTIKDLVSSADNLDPMFVKKIAQKHKSNLEVLLSCTDYPSQITPNIGAMGKILTKLREFYRWVVVDLGVGLDGLHARVLKEADQILLVTEITLPNLQNTKILKALFREWDLDESKLKIVVNRYAKNYTLGLKDLEEILRKPIAFTFPSDYQPLIDAINQGEPLGEVAPRSKLWRRLKDLAFELIEQSKPEAEAQLAARPGLLRRLF